MFPLRDHARTEKFPFITILIIGLNFFVFLLELTSPNLEAFVNTYALIPAKVDFYKISTLIPFLTSMFLHAGFVHIISNMWFLWVFGDNMEANLGRIRFFFYYLFCGLVAAVFQYLIISSSQVPMLGASGAIAGVLGGYLVLFPRARIETLVVTFGGFLTTVEVPAAFMLLYWFFIQIFNGTMAVVVGSAASGGVAWWAHIGGFICGWILARFRVNQTDKDQLL